MNVLDLIILFFRLLKKLNSYYIIKIKKLNKIFNWEIIIYKLLILTKAKAISFENFN